MTALVVVCGAPASGKTTPARRLARDLALPLLEKDTIKESLADALGIPDREASKKLRAASMQLLYDLALGVLLRGSSVMIEANFNRSFAEDALRRMAGSARIQIVQCQASATTTEHRYRDRYTAGERHPIHVDLDRLQDLIAGLELGTYDLTDLEYPSFSVRTDDGYEPGFNRIVEHIKRHRDAHT